MALGMVVATVVLIAVAVGRVVWVLGRRPKAAALALGEVVKCGKYASYVRYKHWIFKAYLRGRHCTVGQRVAILTVKPSGQVGYLNGKAEVKYLNQYSVYWQIRRLFQVEQVLKRFQQYGNAVLGGKQTSMLMAMLFGDRYLTNDLFEAFKAKGLAHVSAVSGYNVAIFLAIMTQGFLFVGRHIRRYLEIPFILLFGVIVEPAIPVKRAQISAILCRFESIFRGKCHFANNTFFTFLIHVILSPADIFSLSFQLTYAAIAGLLLINFLKTRLRVHNMFVVNLGSILGVNILTSLVLFMHKIVPSNMVVALFWNVILGELIDIIVFLGYWGWILFGFSCHICTQPLFHILKLFLNVLSLVLQINI